MTHVSTNAIQARRAWIPRIPAAATFADHHAGVYAGVSVWLALCAICHVYVVVALFSNAIYWLTYYVADYRYGFVRRGLGGELIGLFPDRHYFTAAYGILWMSTAVWLTAVGALMRVIVHSGVKSERKIMLALAVPVLPCSFSYAVYNPHPELFGMAALLAFSISLTRLRTPRSRTIASALFGATMAALALLHEAIPLIFGVGAVLAIVVLLKDATPVARRICAALAVAPGLISVVLVALLGRRDVAAQLCAQVPHRMVDNPWAAARTPQQIFDYLLGRVDSRTDYHDWVCDKTLPILDADVNAAVQMVTHYGFAQHIGSLLLGLSFLSGTIWTVRYLSGVPASALLNQVRQYRISLALTSTFLVPLFLTAVDWTRWCGLITFDVVGVYILYAVGRPEIEQPPTRRNVLVFACIVVALAVLPTGAANNAGG